MAVGGIHMSRNWSARDQVSPEKSELFMPKTPETNESGSCGR